MVFKVRIIFRLAEYADGTDVNNPALANEWYEYVFDALPMLFALIILNIFHPGRALVGPDSNFPKLSRKQKKELKRQKKQEKIDRKMMKKNGKIDYTSSMTSNSMDVPFTSLGPQEQGNSPYYQQDSHYYQQDPNYPQQDSRIPAHATYRR